MSKVVYICTRNGRTDSFSDRDLEIISERIAPDNIQVLPPVIIRDKGVISAIFSPSKANETQETAILLGKALLSTNWWIPGTIVPEGSFALFRSDIDKIELVTDAVASRTIWFFNDDETFLASTSQRALVMLMKNFSPNANVLPWMLSTGTLGPSNSWDSRIQQVPADSVVSFDRKNWSLKVDTKQIEFASQEMPVEVFEDEVKETLFETFKKLNLNFNSWVLPLSGGFDSRAILCLFKKTNIDLTKLKAITWGTENALLEKGNDAFVAKKLAEHLQIPHQYFSTSVGQEPLEKILDRFLLCGEGRVDHIGGYMDGFVIWQTLYNNQIQGIIRGDEGFGWVEVDDPLNVRSRIGISLCSDFSNLKDYREFGIAEHSIPPVLQQRESESLEEWRDRLYHQFRIPVVLAALNDLKLGYVEIINPLLFRSIIYKIRRLPNHLRTGKFLFKKIGHSISPPIEYATAGANQSKKTTLSSKEMVELLSTELSSHAASSVFSGEFIELLISKLRVKEGTKGKNKSLKSTLASYMPKWMRIGAKTIVSKPGLDNNVLAFRAFIAVKMNQILAEDARALKNADLLEDKVV